MAIRDGSWIDTLWAALFALSVAVSAGAISFGVYGIDFRDVLWQQAGLTIDVASAISIGAILWALFLGIPNFSDLAVDKLAAIVLTVGIVAVGMLDPGFASNAPELGILSVGITGAGYWTLYWEGM